MNTIAKVMFMAVLAAPAAFAQDVETLLEQARCGACHQVAQPMLGPSYEAVAERYRDQEGAADEIHTRMREGSQGIWGDAPMPPVTQDALSDQQLEAVIAWILNR